MSRLNYLLDADFAVPLDLGVQAFMDDNHSRRAILDSTAAGHAFAALSQAGGASE